MAEQPADAVQLSSSDSESSYGADSGAALIVCFSTATAILNPHESVGS